MTYSKFLKKNMGSLAAVVSNIARFNISFLLCATAIQRRLDRIKTSVESGADANDWGFVLVVSLLLNPFCCFAAVSEKRDVVQARGVSSRLGYALSRL